MRRISNTRNTNMDDDDDHNHNDDKERDDNSVDDDDNANIETENTTAHDDEIGQIANKKCDLAASKVLSKIVAERSRFPLPGVCSLI